MSSLDVRLKKLEILLAPPGPTYLEILRAAYALRAQRQAETAQGNQPKESFHAWQS